MADARGLMSPSGGLDETRRKMLIEVMIKADYQTRIARRMGVSTATVSAASRDLVNEGLVKIKREKRASVLELTPIRGVCLGIDLGFRRTAVIARRVDRPFGEVFSHVRPEGANRGFPQILPVLRELIADAVADSGQRLGDVVSAGIAVPRMIDPRTGQFTHPVLPPWLDDDNPAEALGEHLGLHVAIDNDANLGAMAEQTYGLDEPVETVVYIKASTGVGAGIMIGDKPLRGEQGMAGEIGHLTIDRGGDVCLCGGRGCLDTVVGAEALLRQVRQASRWSGYGQPDSLKELIDAAHRGNAACLRILNDAGRTLGLALAQLCNLINPRLVIIGGELSGGREHVLVPCRQELERFALAGTVRNKNRFELRTSGLNPLAEAQGALILGLRSRQLETTTEEAAGPAN
jgi:predicted NBD/HSP70 family sugar kinase